jgi:hypothetical protein
MASPIVKCCWGFPSPLADRIELHEISGQSIQWAVIGFAIEIGDRKIAAFACHICGDGLIGIAMRAGNCPSTLAGNLAVVLLQKQPGPRFYAIYDCGRRQTGLTVSPRIDGRWLFDALAASVVSQ